MYKHSFSCKINCTKVKQTATKLHESPDETQRAWSWSLLQMRDSDSDPGPKPRLGRLHTHVCEALRELAGTAPPPATPITKSYQRHTHHHC